MARQCEVCGKGMISGNKISHSNSIVEENGCPI